MYGSSNAYAVGGSEGNPPPAGHVHHMHSQSLFCDPANSNGGAGGNAGGGTGGQEQMQQRRRLMAPRQASMDLSLAQMSALNSFGSPLSAGAVAAALGGASTLQQPPRGRSSIITGQSSLAPINSVGLGRSDMMPLPRHNHSPSPSPHPLADSGGGGDRSPMSAGPLFDREPQMAPLNVAAASASAQRGRSQLPGLAASASTRTLSPLRARAASTASGATPGSSNTNTPRVTSPLVSAATAAAGINGASGGGGAAGSVNSSPTFSSMPPSSPSSSSAALLVASNAPTLATHMPGASGIIVALHVSDSVFLTSPETLMRAQAHEQTASMSAAGGGRGRSLSSLRDVSGQDAPSLLQWIAEDAMVKHREAEAAAVASRRAQKARASGQPADSSPRIGATSAHQHTPGSGAGVHSTVHQSAVASAAASTTEVQQSSSATLPFHSATYAYFLDRSPKAYPLLLTYCRDGSESLRNLLVASAPWPGSGVSADAAMLASLKAEADFLSLTGLASLVEKIQASREVDRLLGEDDRFWADVVHTIDEMFPDSAGGGGQSTPGRDRPGNHSPSSAPSVTHAGRPISPLSRMAPLAVLPAAISSGALTSRRSVMLPLQRNSNLQRNIGAMLRRLAFNKDELLRVCHASYRDTENYEDRLLEILHTTCTLCKRTIYYKPIGLREGRDTGCPVHPQGGQWDRKARMWTCCGSPDFKDSGCQFTGIHYTTWTFFNSAD